MTTGKHEGLAVRCCAKQIVKDKKCSDKSCLSLRLNKCGNYCANTLVFATLEYHIQQLEQNVFDTLAF